MKRTCLVIVIWFALTHSFAFAQDEKTELAVFAGGYFNSGFQSFKVLNPTTGARLGTFKPVSEANSGIFGVRSSYNFRPQMAAEATFGFSPAGRSQNSFPFGMAVPVLVVPVESQQAIPIAVRSPVLRDGNVYLYSGTLKRAERHRTADFVCGRDTYFGGRATRVEGGNNHVRLGEIGFRPATDRFHAGNDCVTCIHNRGRSGDNRVRTTDNRVRIGDSRWRLPNKYLGNGNECLHPGINRSQRGNYRFRYANSYFLRRVRNPLIRWLQKFAGNNYFHRANDRLHRGINRFRSINNRWGSTNNRVPNGNDYARHDNHRGRSVNKHVRCGSNGLNSALNCMEDGDDRAEVINN